MEDTENAIVLVPVVAHYVARDVQDDEALELLELDGLSNVAYQVVA